MFSRKFTFRRRATDQISGQEGHDIHPAHHDAGDDRTSVYSGPSEDRKFSVVSSSDLGDEAPSKVGLNVVYTPDNGHKADIVFVHGLGGHSKWTWCKSRDSKSFWPLTFLPLEPDLCLARILTFGYDTEIRKDTNLSTSVAEIAKQMLFALKHGLDTEEKAVLLGEKPLIFVVHSVGGLIFKEAYLHGSEKAEYEKIIKSIAAIAFIATPHRGLHLSDTLSRILQCSLSHLARSFTVDLSKTAVALQKVNEQFVLMMSKLQVFSFYETEMTTVRPKSAKIMVLSSDLSVMKYPGEHAAPLKADHLGITRYDSAQDPNYLIVRNTLKALMQRLIAAGSTLGKDQATRRRESTDLRSVLAIQASPDIDYSFYSDQRTPDTNEFIWSDLDFLTWLNAETSAPAMFWLRGGPGSGKSVLVSSIIRRMVESGRSTQYFFVRYGSRNKRTLSLLLRSIAYQVAKHSTAVFEAVVELGKQGYDLEVSPAFLIWERVFRSVILKTRFDKPLYWIVDALDEADEPLAFTKLLPEVIQSNPSIRILVSSRPTTAISSQIRKDLSSDVVRFSLDGRTEDVRQYIEHELHASKRSAGSGRIIRRILEGSENSFLWTRLAVERLNASRSWKWEDLEQVLIDLPSGMTQLYDRMLRSIAENFTLSEQSLAYRMLRCVTSCFRNLTVVDLAQALGERIEDAQDFQAAVLELCSGFVKVDLAFNVALIHHTAQEFLSGAQDPQLDRQLAHGELFLSCMSELMSPGLRAKIQRKEISGFLAYSTRAWYAHLSCLDATSVEAQKVLRKFFTTEWILTWIHILSATDRLRDLVQASKQLTAYATQLDNSNPHALSVDTGLVKSWSLDLIKLLGKFGTNLRANPGAIYKILPQFCPRDSAIHRQFAARNSRNLTVSGLSNSQWDDLSARLSLNAGCYASKMSVAGTLVATLATQTGHVYLHDTRTFEEVNASPIQHGQRVHRMLLSASGSTLVTYGHRTVKIWNIANGQCTFEAPVIKGRPTPLAMLLKDNKETLVVASADRRIRSLDLTTREANWHMEAELDEEEMQGHFFNAASVIALSQDGMLVAIAYRGHVLSCFETEGPYHVGHCWRARKESARGEVKDMVWHPLQPILIGLYIEGCIFKWNPYMGEPEEYLVGGTNMTLSREGDLLATGDTTGKISIYATENFRLIYRTVAQENILGITFSPDSLRLYDVRGYYANVWEPDVLMRHAQRSAKSSDLDADSDVLSIASDSPTAIAQVIEAVTALAPNPKGMFYASGLEFGTVELFHVQHGRLAPLHISKGALAIEHLAWDPTGEAVSFLDSSNRLIARSLTKIPISPFYTATTILDVPLSQEIEDTVRQLIFLSRAAGILIVTDTKLLLIATEGNSSIQSLEWDNLPCHFLPHPLVRDQILALHPSQAYVLTTGLEIHATTKISLPEFQGHLQDQNLVPTKVDCAIPTADGRYVLLQMSQKAKKSKTLWMCALSKSASLTVDDPLILHELPQSFADHIARPLAFLPQNRLAFLSSEYYVSIAKLPIPTNVRQSIMTGKSKGSEKPSDTSSGLQDQSLSDEETIEVTDLFMLRGDWISRDDLALCNVWVKESCFLCPKNGEVAVVQCASLR